MHLNIETRAMSRGLYIYTYLCKFNLHFMYIYVINCVEYSFILKMVTQILIKLNLSLSNTNDLRAAITNTYLAYIMTYCNYTETKEAMTMRHLMPVSRQ